MGYRFSFSLGSVLLVALVAILGYQFSRTAPAAAGAGTCSAFLNWSTSTVNQGAAATETWAIVFDPNVTGSKSASGRCFDQSGMDRSVTGLSFGPQSFTFNNIQSNLTCYVTGYIDEVESCTSGPQTVNVMSTPTTTPAPTSTTPTPPTPPVSSGGSCNLFPRSLSYIPENLPPLPITPGPSTLSFSFPANQSVESSPYYDWGHGAVEEYLASQNVSMTALDPLPPGLSFGSRTVNYPEANIIGDGVVIDGLKIEDYVVLNRKTGYPPLTRYHFSGFPTVQGQTKVRLQATSGTCTQTQTFTINVTAPEPPVEVYVVPNLPPAPSSTNGIIKFVKTLFYNDPAPGGAQHLRNLRTWGKNGDKFVFVGDYGGRIAGLGLNTRSNAPGGGLITVQEDGSKIVERDAAIDAGSGSNQIYQHGHRHASAEIFYEWGSGGFLIQNGSWASCLVNIRQSDWCPEFGPGANRPVYYRAGTDGFPVPAGKSPPESQGHLIGLKNRVMQPGGNLYSLPRWVEEGSADPGLTGFGFGDFVVNDDGKVYFVDDSGASEEVMNVLDPGYTSFRHAFDHSVYPPKLAIWEKPALPPGYASMLTVDLIKYVNERAKIKIFKLSGDQIVFEKNITPPADNGPYHFAIWGSYVIIPGVVDNTYGIDVWKDGQKIDSVKLPAGSTNFTPIAISRNGYVAVAVQLAAREATAFLYKLNVTPPTVTTPPVTTPPIGTPPVGTPPVTPPPPPLTGDECVDAYRELCDEITELKRRLCLLAPTLDICES